MLRLFKELERRAAAIRRVDPSTEGPPFGVLRRRLATVAGAVVLGLAALAFAALGDWAQRSFATLVGVAPYAPLLLSPLIFALVVAITRRWAPDARGSGIPQVIAATKVPEVAAGGPLVSLKTGASKLGLAVAMLLGGASLGREGPTVQVSAALMVATHRLLRVPITAGVLIAGGAAGVAAAFNTPLAGVAFAIEELAAAYEQRIAVLVMGAVMIAGLVSLGVAGDYIYFGAMRQTLSLGSMLTVAPLAGLAGGLSGGLFSRAVQAFALSRRPLLAMLRRHPIMTAAACGLIVAAIGVAGAGTTWGTGYETTRRLVEARGEPLWFGPAKFVATLATAVSGAPGGIFAPSLSVGAGLGNLLSALFPGIPAGPVVLLGMAGYFVGVVRSPFTAVIIISETTAGRAMILPLFATALIADGVSALVCRERLYHALSKPYVPASGAVTAPGG